jgi:hypothetical protein
MTVGSVLARGRTAARQLMTDTITISRVTGQVYNPATLDYDPTTATLYTGPADVKPLDLQNREVQAGEREVAVRSFDVKLPFGTAAANVAGDFTRGDVVTVTSSADASLIGRMLVVTGVGHGGRRTARHLDVEDQT